MRALVPGIDAKGENLPEHRISNFEELFPGQEAEGTSLADIFNCTEKVAV